MSIRSGEFFQGFFEVAASSLASKECQARLVIGGATLGANVFCAIIGSSVPPENEALHLRFASDDVTRDVPV
jgi:hypothetical protein